MEKYSVAVLTDKDYASPLDALVAGGFGDEAARRLVAEWEMNNEPILGVEISSLVAPDIRPIATLTKNPDGRILVWMGSLKFLYDSPADAESSAAEVGFGPGEAWAVFSWRARENLRH